MDINLAIKTGYFENLSYGLNIPVYDAFSVPANAVYPYVIIASINPTEELNSKCKSWDAFVTLDIVTGFSSPKGMKQAYEISGLIEDIINPASRVQIDLSAYGYQIGQTRSSTQSNQFRSDNYWIYRCIKTFSHIIWSV